MIYSTAEFIRATRPGEILRPLKPTLVLALATILASSAGCDRLGDIVIVPEFDLTYSFEGGLEGWVPGGIDLEAPATPWSIEVASEVVSTGNASARFRLDNQNGKGKIWITRAFEVEPERSYDIEVRLDVASADTADPWRLLVGAHTEPPTASGDLTVQDVLHLADGAYVWEARSHTVRGTSDDEGNLYVLLGVWGTSVGERSYYLDNVRLLFTRVNAGV